MSLEDDLNQSVEKAVGGALAETRMQSLLAGRMSQAELHAFFRRFIVAHLNDSHTLAFLYSLAPPDEAAPLRQDLAEALATGEPEDKEDRPGLLMDLARALGFTSQEQERLIAEANDARRRFAAGAGANLIQAGLAVLLETLAFQAFLSQADGPIAEALTRHHRLSPEAVRWLTLHAQPEFPDAGEAANAVRTTAIERYVSFHRLSPADAQAVAKRAFARNPILERYFPPAPPAAGTSTRGRLAAIDIMPLEIPFTGSGTHAVAGRPASNPIVVRVRDAGGVAGYGEALPRPGVLGEDAADTVERLRSVLAPQALQSGYASGPAVGEEIRSAEARWSRARRPDDTATAWNAAQCALELAIFDWAFKRYGASLSELLIPARRDVVYTGVIDADEPEAAALVGKRFADAGLGRVKVRVGDRDDVARLDAVRGAVGPDVAVRIDANGAWSADEAIRALAELQPFGIEAVEQPVAASDIEGMRRVREETGMRIVADESLVRIKDAQTLLKANACDVFNIGVSKCGGLITSRRLALAAREAGLGIQIGAQVGETSILAAAGRRLAAHLPDLESLEGAFGPDMLAEDIAREPVAFGYAGQAALLVGDGLGIDVDDDALERLALDVITVTA